MGENMRIKLEYHDITFQLERQPLPESRFRAVCGLAAAGIYAGMAVGVAALCGLPGVVAVAVVTGIIAALSIMSL